MSTKGLTIGFFIADAALIAVCAFFYLQMDRTAPVITLPDVGRYALQRARGRERNPVCLLPCHSHCRSPVPQPHDGQAFSE